MSRLVWDQTGERTYETGVDRGVLYPIQDSGLYTKGYAWNGLSSVTESPSGAEPEAIYADNIKYLSLLSVEEYGGTIEAYTYPDAFAQCDGSAEIAGGVTIGQQARKTFGFCYRSLVGNDVDFNDYGYKLHLIYGALATPSDREHSTVNDSPEAATMSWEFSTTPVNVAGFKPTSCVTIDSTKVDKDKLAALEDVLYGTELAEARLPLPDELMELMAASDSDDGGTDDDGGSEGSDGGTDDDGGNEDEGGTGGSDDGGNEDEGGTGGSDDGGNEDDNT